MGARGLAVAFAALALAGCGEQFSSNDDADAGSDGGTCIPTSCQTLGAECGIAPDGCGSTVQCGGCPSGEVCGGGGPNKCGTTACTPTTCDALDADCGLHSDGCGNALECGTCESPMTCGGGGTPYQCGCTPRQCDGHCGKLPDDCGNTLECGGCPSGQVCGGGGQNLCGNQPCTPTTCADEGKNCGTIADGCGDTINCGSCSSNETCGGGGTQNVCGCTPKTCASTGKNCGSVQDGCGNTLDCGTCTAPETCGGGGPNVCGCSNSSCLPGWCGAIQDGCGNTVLCPSGCGGGYDCSQVTHQCVACVVGVCAGSGGKCVVSSPCDGTNYIPVYCPCNAGELCDLDTGNCI